MTKINIIAEPDISHDGSIETIIQHIKIMASVGCNYFKLQAFNVDRLGDDWVHKREFYRRRQLTDIHFKEALSCCQDYGMELLVTVNDSTQPERMWNLGIKNVKIASVQIDKKLIDTIVKYQWDKVFVSTGMLPDLETLEQCYKIHRLDSPRDLVVMHCVSKYPVGYNELNLKRINELIMETDAYVEIGYSDHMEGNELIGCIAAMLRGATYIEKHTRLHNQYTPMWMVSATPETMAELCRWRILVEEILGEGQLEMQECEEVAYEKYHGRWKI